MKIHRQNNRCNISGIKIKELRLNAGYSQEALAALLQLEGLNVNQKAISRIESGDRVVADFELQYFAEVFHVPVTELLMFEKN
ncbi:helix-turn-helix domain-containing protein [Ruminococcus sp. CLA-AA-H200]|uniref:Helix-turn-helix domain-containing protein n=1 Tax=Ruminococcus turbiniformis TaxID=2881258 RepID=A0ABS8FZU5_9FIRM|nr:helix-turn-helix transcriptional regulator [Ruminococcus turbiniformis]MCC2255565.1 helix-turn-helix domain-containing protein [Ruminococcus turbiniformis]